MTRDRRHRGVSACHLFTQGFAQGTICPGRGLITAPGYFIGTQVLGDALRRGLLCRPFCVLPRRRRGSAKIGGRGHEILRFRPEAHDLVLRDRCEGVDQRIGCCRVSALHESNGNRVDNTLPAATLSALQAAETTAASPGGPNRIRSAPARWLPRYGGVRSLRNRARPRSERRAEEQSA